MNIPLAGALLVCVLASRAVAQTVPIAGRLPERPAQASSPAPRLADGRPDLGNGKGAWNPRVIANLAGVGGPGRSPVETIVDVPFQAWAKAVYELRQTNLQQHDPESRCLPPGLPRLMATPFPFQIFQQSDRVLFVFEGGAHVWRAIYTDGRGHPKDPNPSFLGDSIGRWDGATLVVDTTNFRPDTHNVDSGERLHVVERFMRIDATTMRYRVTAEDPDTWTTPWTAEWPFKATDRRVFAAECHEGNRAIEGFLRGARAEERERQKP